MEKTIVNKGNVFLVCKKVDGDRLLTDYAKETIRDTALDMLTAGVGIGGMKREMWDQNRKELGQLFVNAAIREFERCLEDLMSPEKQQEVSKQIIARIKELKSVQKGEKSC